MNARITKQYRNGNVDISITREVTTVYHVFRNDPCMTDDEIANGDYTVNIDAVIDELPDNIYAVLDSVLQS